jgi:hypothetical protein
MCKTFITEIALINFTIILKSSLLENVSEINCEKPPKPPKYKLFECCAIPGLFKSEIKEKCIAECSGNSSTASKTNPWCCMTNCTMVESSIAVNGQIDKIQARKVFKSIFESSADALKVDNFFTLVKFQ